MSGGGAARPPLHPVPAAEARRLLQAAADAITVTAPDVVPLEAAAGRVLVRAVVATEDLPGFARSMMDGYAIRSADVAAAAPGGAVSLRVVGAVVMGERPALAVGPGEALEIPTGGHLPDGADAVVPIEAVAAGGGHIAVTQAISRGRNVIQRGEDLREGTAVLPAGRRLRAVDVGALAALGATRVEVHRRPRVAVLSTGTELCAPSETPAPGQVRDINQYLLGARAQDAGCEVTRAGIVEDDPAALDRAVRQAAAGHEVVIVSGGSSVGVRDHTAAVFAALGDPGVIFHGIQVRPGRPTILARSGRTLLLGVPGVPAAAVVIFEVFVRDLLRRVGGELVSAPPAVLARLATAHPSPRGREDYVRVRLVSRDGGTWAEPIAGGAGALSGMLAADGLVIVAAETELVAAGEVVAVRLIG